MFSSKNVVFALVLVLALQLNACGDHSGGDGDSGDGPVVSDPGTSGNGTPEDPGGDPLPGHAAVGEGETCGTIVGIVCEEGLFCKLPTGQCNVADAAGTCTRISEVCTREYSPVCGCDGKTYSNACSADAAAVSIEYEGECES